VGLAVEFLDRPPVNVVFPDLLALKDTDAAPPTHQQADSNFKTAKLERTEVLVPQFVKTGDVIRLHIETLNARADAGAGTE